jgi:transposase-like protein
MFRCFDSSPEVIRLVVMMYVRFRLMMRNVGDILVERGVDICHEIVRLSDCARYWMVRSCWRKSLGVRPA